MTHRRSALLLVAALVLGLLPAARVSAQAGGGLSRWVDPLVGSFAPGFTNPGPVLPHGMVGLGPDTAEGPLNYGGYYSTNAVISGFSHTHMSAGVWQGGHIPVLPVVGDVDTTSTTTPGTAPIPAYASPFDRATEVAEAGRYEVTLLRYGVRAELTATERVGVHRYTYPAAPAGDRRVVVDVGRTLGGMEDARLELLEDGTLTGTVLDDVAGPLPVSFALRADQPLTWTAFDGSPLEPGALLEGDGLGAIGTLAAAAPSTLVLKVGISYTDVEGAVRNLEAEVPGFDVDAVRTAAVAAWDAALGRVEVEGGTDLQRTSLYTALYHALLFPNLHSDVDGRYRGADQRVHDAPRPRYSQFSLWDSYRGQSALQAVLDPVRYRDMVDSLRDVAAKGGRLPRWQLGANNPGYMSGDPALPFIGEAWCRGILDEERRTELAVRMRDLVDARRPEYRDLGYLPVPPPDTPFAAVEGGPREAGTTLEYGVADFALALMEDADGRTAEADALVASSLGYRRLLDPETGWIRPRHADGTWLEPFLPELGYGFQEGTSWQYSWLAMHDYAGLLERMGDSPAPDADPEQRLDTFFNLPASGTVPLAWPKLQNQITAFGTAYYGNQFAPGNEHDLEAPAVYAWTGAPWKAQAAYRAATSIYTPTPDGLPGNDDLGALSGWLVWALLGLNPVIPGAPLYVIGSPTFERAVLHRPDGRDLVLEAPGASPAAGYVQGARFDDVLLDRAWVTEEELVGLGPLTLEVGGVPSTTWASGPEDAPPSASTHDLSAFGCAPGT